MTGCFGGCLGDAWMVSWGCLHGTSGCLGVSAGCLQGVWGRGAYWGMSVGYLEDVYGMSGDVLGMSG